MRCLVPAATGARLVCLIEIEAQFAVERRLHVNTVGDQRYDVTIEVQGVHEPSPPKLGTDPVLEFTNGSVPTRTSHFETVSTKERLVSPPVCISGRYKTGCCRCRRRSLCE